MAIKRLDINTTKFFSAVLISFIIIQAVSFLLAELDIMPLIKMGWVLFLFLIIIGITSIFILGKKIGTLNLKQDGPFILLVFGLIIILFVFLPDIVPQIFSSKSLEISETIKETLNTIIPMGPGGITPR